MAFKRMLTRSRTNEKGKDIAREAAVVTLILLSIDTGSVFCSFLSTESRHTALPQSTMTIASATRLRDAKLGIFAPASDRPDALDERPLEKDISE
jgi:hypothetical protein